MNSEAITLFLAKQEITEQIYRYCRAVDRIDVEMGYSVWAENAIADFEPLSYVGDGRGFIDWLAPVHHSFACTSHQVTNILIAVEGDEADSESCFLVVARTKEEDGAEMDRMIFGRYLDRWVRQNGRWLIRERKCVIDMSNTVLVATPWLSANGRRDRSDPSYQLRVE